jgi:hypothetical protein
MNFERRWRKRIVIFAILLLEAFSIIKISKMPKKTPGFGIAMALVLLMLFVTLLFNSNERFQAKTAAVTKPPATPARPRLTPCPAGMRDDGEDCLLDSYSRHTHRKNPALKPCPPGSRQDGMVCYRDIVVGNRRGTQMFNRDEFCPEGAEERIGTHCYPRCKSLYRSQGEFCVPPNGNNVQIRMSKRIMQ